MGDFLRVEHGAVPWQPAHDIELLDEYDRFDVPTLGIIRQDGVEYRFRCVAGFGSTVSVWAYNLLHPGERQVMEDALDAGTFDSIFGALPATPSVVAIVADGFGIVASRDMPDGATDTDPVLDDLFEEFNLWVQGLATASTRVKSEWVRS